MGSQMQGIVPGARIEVRDAEWLVKRTEQSGNSRSVIHAVGLTGIVRNKEAIFVKELEETHGGIKVVDPTSIEFVSDDSSHFKDTLLYLEGQIQRALPVVDKPVIADRAAIDNLPFQLLPTEIALAAPRVRILIADDVGLGKTLEAGILTSELARRGRAKRILVIVTKSMLTQFQKEIWTRFSIPLTRIDSVGIGRVRSKIPSNHNPFHYFDRAIISVDTLKNDLQYRTAIENAWWDLIIIDEAHNVAERSGTSGVKSQRSKLAKRLASRSDALVLLSATPHDGSLRSFASLMLMLDPTSIADPDNYGPEDIEGLFVRRFRTTYEVDRDLGSKIPKRSSMEISIHASKAEEAAFDVLENLELRSDEGVNKATQLFKTTLEKSLFSSPFACAETLERRINKISVSKDRDEQADLQLLSGLLDAVKVIEKDNFSKYEKLLELLKEINWNGKVATDRLVIFSERIATLNWLDKNLRLDLGLKENAVSTLHGSMSDIVVQEVVDDFGQERKPIRLLIASDMASEGINLHYQCHKLIHFDIPWAIMTFQQRNGRIDRYGQTRQPLIRYLTTKSANERIRGDQRILEVLIHKDEKAQQSIGDPSLFLGTYDEDEQKEVVAEAMTAGKSAGVFSDELDANADHETSNKLVELESMIMSASEGSQGGPSQEEPEIKDVPRIFNSVFKFSSEALNRIKEKTSSIKFVVDDVARIIDIDLPDDFKEPGNLGVGMTSTIDTRWMPREAVPKDGSIKLTDDRVLIREQILKSRTNDENSWPDTQYLWEIHPFVDWLSDKTASFFSRRQAPVMRVEDSLNTKEVIFLFNGVVRNRKGYAIVDEWFGVRFYCGDCTGVKPFPAILRTLDLRRKRPNPGSVKTGDLRSLVDKSVDCAREHLRKVRDNTIDRINAEHKTQQKRLQARCARHEIQLQQRIDLEKDNRSAQEAGLDVDLSAIKQKYEDYWKWIEDNRHTEDDTDPYVRIAAVFRG